MNSELLQRLQWKESIIAGLVLAFLYHFTIYNNGSLLKKRIHTARTAIATKNRELDKINQALREKDQTEQELGLVSDQFKRVLQYFPTDLSEADLERAIIDEARKAGTKNLRVQPDQEYQSSQKKGDFYEALGVQINFEGTYSEIAAFMSAMTKIPRLLTIRSISIDSKLNGKKTGDPILDFKGTITGYRYIEASPEKKNAK